MTHLLGETVLRRGWLVPGTIVTVAALWVGLAAMQGARGQTAAPPRLSGTNRFETAVAVSRHRFPDGAARAYAASADMSPDALVAAFDDGPTLLVPPCGTVPEAVFEELDRLGSDEVIVVGGTAAVDHAVGRQLAARAPDPAASCLRPEDLAANVELILSQRRTDEGAEVTGIVENHTAEAITLGPGFSLEARSSEDEWELIGPHGARDYAYKRIPAGGSSQPLLFSPYLNEETEVFLQPGQYRVTVSVFPGVVPPDGQPEVAATYIYATFQVE